MEVNIRFDTEKERVENLKKLVHALQELIAHREGKDAPKEQAVSQTIRTSHSVSSSQQNSNRRKPLADAALFLMRT